MKDSEQTREEKFADQYQVLPAADFLSKMLKGVKAAFIALGSLGGVQLKIATLEHWEAQPVANGHPQKLVKIGPA